MSNELQEFLSLLGRIITFILRWTINLICLCLFAVSLCALWRTIWIIIDVFDEFSWSKFRRKAAVHLVLIVVDLMVFPFAVCSLLMPTRTYHAITDCVEEFGGNHSEYLYVGEARWILFGNAWIGMLDLFCLCFGVLSALIPTRTFAFCRILGHHWSAYTNDDYSSLRYFSFLFFLLFFILFVLIFLKDPPFDEFGFGHNGYFGDSSGDFKHFYSVENLSFFSSFF